MIAALRPGFWRSPLGGAIEPQERLLRSATKLAELDRTAEHIIDSAPVALLVAELEGQIVRWNEGAAKLLSIPSEEAIGQDVFTLFPGLRSAVTRVREQTTNRLGASELQDCMLITPTGSVRVDVRFAPVQQPNGSYSSFILLLEDTESRRMSESEAMRHVRAQHDSLLREIHHRIKNHLHGVIALIRAQSLQADAGQQIETIVDQLMAISHAHGIQAESNSGRTNLAKLTEQIAAGCRSARNALIALDDVPLILRELVVAEHASVPVALVITELLTNAAKHGILGIIVVRLRETPKGVAIDVINRGTLDVPATTAPPIGFRGLQLARSILPAAGASLTLEQAGENVVATLSLDVPEIVGPSGEYVEDRKNAKVTVPR
jgi:PAS domain S-box-containing protein